MKKRLFRIFSSLVIVYVLIGAGLYFFQENFIFQSTTLTADYTFNSATPFEEIYLKNKDASLSGLHFKVKEPKGVLLYFHGNAGDLSRWSKIVEPLLKFNYDIVVMDYRGYGKSTGERNEKQMYEDADLFYQYSKSFVADSNIVVYGRSLGTTFATYVAAKNSPQKLMLESPFYSLTNVAKQRFAIYPIQQILKFNFPTYLYLPEVKCPVIIMHGRKDRVVPYENAALLFKLNATDSEKKLLVIPEGHHNDLSEFQEYWTCLRKELSINY